MSETTPEVEDIYRRLQQMPIAELLVLNRLLAELLGGEGGAAAGVREPRVPAPDAGEARRELWPGEEIA